MLTAPSRPQGGFGILEEMCVNYVHYYPQTQLELCKSAVDAGFLQKYFHLASWCGSARPALSRGAAGSPAHTRRGGRADVGVRERGEPGAAHPHRPLGCWWQASPVGPPLLFC